ncbi:hypothetical protein M0811_11325 [Anaeramoeba ignava]|uniref:Uncharacterized protein n=1 Tax=Anaeramoeba ignava TaxID=1746090 RepID=A0A9Q0LDM2_ANAIG|nr:hypothetical protein M0811_11325 [Anaeramoeba ignava]
MHLILLTLLTFYHIVFMYYLKMKALNLSLIMLYFHHSNMTTEILEHLLPSIHFLSSYSPFLNRGENVYLTKVNKNSGEIPKLIIIYQ